MKNTLSAVQSIAWQALRNSSDPDEVRESIESRLFALSRSHDLLTRHDWTGAGLYDLIAEALEPFGVTGGRSARLTITGENIPMSSKATLALGIAFHELATNAVKYGAFSNNAGSIQIAWAVEASPEGDRLVVRWQEKDGPLVKPPSRRGFGSQVIERGLAHELEGTVQLPIPPAGPFAPSSFQSHEVHTMPKLLSGMRVLVVEDEMMVLFMIEDILADLGCASVTTAATVGEALAQIETHTFDVAMLDSNLGGTRSDAIAAVLDDRGVPLFFCTGYGDLGAKDGYRTRHVLKKPFKRQDVEASFMRVLFPLH